MPMQLAPPRSLAPARFRSLPNQQACNSSRRANGREVCRALSRSMAFDSSAAEGYARSSGRDSTPMPTIQRGDATIYYEERGSGPPLLLLAPGGLNSTVDFWSRMPLNPLDAFSNDFRVIAMDQRNAGRSSGPLETDDPWKMYADDQLAVLDHLGVDQFIAIGCCIGCSFIFQVMEQAPQRLVAGVPMQPIGHDETNAGVFGPDMWTPWGQNLIDKSAQFSMDELNAFGH